MEDPASPPALGGLKAEYFTNLAGTTLADLTGSLIFPNAPDIVEVTSQFESRTDWADNYGARLSGWLIPPTTGDYRFYLAADDQGALFLSTDESPVNKLQIASEPAWNSYQDYITGLNQAARGNPPVNISTGIPLVAGRAYYVEALLKEGSGGDHLSVAWQKPGDAAPVNGAAPIPGAYLASTLHNGVLPPNNPPVAADDAYTTGEDTVLNVASPGVLGNDTDPDQGPLITFKFAGHMLSADADFTAGESFTGYYSLDPAAVGFDHPDSTLNFQYPTPNATWELSFPDTGYKFSGDLTYIDVGNDTSFGDRYVATLYHPASVGTPLPSGRQLSLAQFDLQDRVAAGADMLQDDSIQTTTVNLASAQSVGGRFLFIGNDQPQLTLDQLNGPMSVTQVNGQAASVNTTITLASGATLRVNSNGSFSYDPSGHFDQLRPGETATEVFTYEMSDREGATANATVTITITGVNDAPAVAHPIPEQNAVYGAAFSVTVSANTFSDPDTAQPLTCGASGMPPGISFDTGTRTFSGTPTVVGTFTVTVVATDNGVPPLSASTTFNLVVGKAALTVTADSFTRSYGEANPPLTGTLVSVVNGDNLTATYTTTATPSGAAGVYTIYPVLNDPDNKLGYYTVTLINGSLRVNPVSQTITFDPIPAHAYGDAPFAVAASTGSDLSVTLSSSAPTVATVSGNTITMIGAGTAIITATQTGDGSHYPATPVARTLTVARAPLTISAANQTSPYGVVHVLSASYAGFVNGDTAASLSTPVTLTTPATVASVVGTYPITASGATAANYNITFAGGTLMVTPAPLTVTADSKTKIYGAALPALTLSYSGFVNGDTTASLNQAPTLSTTAKKASIVGGYPITLSGGAAANYQVTLVNGTLSVLPAPLTVTAANKSNVYGTALPALTATYVGFVNGDAVASLDTPVVLTTVATIASDVGAYPILASGVTDANYTIAFVPGTLTITPHALTIRAQNKIKTYGATVPAFTATYSGFVNGDTAASLDTPTILESTGADSSPVGTYPISARGASDPNYAITFASGTLTVSPAILTVQAQSASKMYGAALPSLTYAFTGFVLGDTETSLDTPVAITTTAAAGSSVGNYPIQVSGASDANYTVRFVNGALSVTKAPLTITADDKTRRVGQPNPALTASYAGFVNGDTLASLSTPLALSTTATTTSPAGTYTIKATGAKGANYTITFVNGRLTVTP